MFVKSIALSSRLWLGMAALLGLAATGCQSTIGGQTLPSAYYLQDDVQFFPAGPEFRLTREVEELEKYNLRRQRIEEGLGDQP